jgi:ankyrin repeat protein
MEMAASVMHARSIADTNEDVTICNDPQHIKLDDALEQVFLLCENGISPTVQFIFDNYPGLEQKLNERRIIYIADTQMELTPLQVAVASGHSAVVRTLLRQRAVDVNIADPNYAMTALHLGVYFGQSFALEELCKDSRVNFAERTIEGKMALHLAVELGHSSMVETILRLHPNVDLRSKDFDGNNVLHLAARHPNVRIMTLLVNHASLVYLYSSSFDITRDKERVGKKVMAQRQLFEVRRCGLNNFICVRLTKPINIGAEL